MLEFQGRQPAFEDPVAIEKSIKRKRSTEKEVPALVSVVDDVSDSPRRSTRRSLKQVGDYKLLACGAPVNPLGKEPQISDYDEYV